MILKSKMSDFRLKMAVADVNLQPQFNIPINEKLKQLIEQCWSDDPNERPLIYEVFTKLDGVDIDELNDYIDEIKNATDHAKDMWHSILALEKEKNEFALKEKQQQISIQKLEKEKQELV